MPLFQQGGKFPSLRPIKSNPSEDEPEHRGIIRRLSHSEGPKSPKSPESSSPVRMSLLSRILSGSGSSSSSSIPASPSHSTEKEDIKHKDKPLAVDIKITKEVHEIHGAHNTCTPLSPESPVPPSFMGEPKQPANIHDTIESALNAAEKLKGDHPKSPREHTHKQPNITKEDLKHIFSGAPHFLLEKGRHDAWYPHAIFPWDLHVPSIQDMWDRQPLIHPSFALSTLHAHLPVPDEWAKKGHTMMWKDDWRKSDIVRRATFDIGTFELPNMLSVNGKEPGCVGFRYFLELPVADNKRYSGPSVPKGTDYQKLASLPASDAFHIMEHLSNPYSEITRDIVHDRHKLIIEGPTGWKRIGVRDFSIESVVHRLQQLRNIRDEIMERKASTVLDKESTRTMYDNLFAKFLFPPTRVIDYFDRYSLKTQIEVLTEVLAANGAWFDFSLTEWRLRIGQILWEMPPHPDGDFVDTTDCSAERHKAYSERGLERKWFFLQMMLAAELLIRVDAVVRLGILQTSKDIIVYPQDIERFDRLRYGKVDWDLILVRRFFDNVDVHHYPQGLLHQDEEYSSSQDRLTGRRESIAKVGLLTRITSRKRRDALITSADPESSWDYILVPRHTEKQLHGLFAFAQSIGWPGADELKKKLSSKFESGGSSLEVANIYSSPVHNTLPDGYVHTSNRNEMYQKISSRCLLLLQWPHVVSTDASSGQDVGGWMSRTWLSGLILPGESISHFLMATVLENDPKAMEALGPLANLYGGFVYDGKSWWSKMSVVGRVLSCLESTTGCMGWMKSLVVPRDVHSGEAIGDTWLEVEMREVTQTSKKPRIHHGTKMALQSTPLGMGALSNETFSLPVDQPSADTEEIEFEGLFLSRTPEQEAPQKGVTVAKRAYISFRVLEVATSKATIISWPLLYNIYFISSYTCLPPHGYAKIHGSTLPENTAVQECKPSSHTATSRLPGHPLHTSYPYKYIPLASLADIGASALPSHNPSSASTSPETWILDARGKKDREAFTRAWCASVGASAVVSRVGRTCLACSIREARAVDVSIVIRIGDD